MLLQNLIERLAHTKPDPDTIEGTVRHVISTPPLEVRVRSPAVTKRWLDFDGRTQTRLAMYFVQLERLRNEYYDRQYESRNESIFSPSRQHIEGAEAIVASCESVYSCLSGLGTRAIDITAQFGMEIGNIDLLFGVWWTAAGAIAESKFLTFKFMRDQWRKNPPINGITDQKGLLAMLPYFDPTKTMTMETVFQSLSEALPLLQYVNLIADKMTTMGVASAFGISTEEIKKRAFGDVVYLTSLMKAIDPQKAGAELDAWRHLASVKSISGQIESSLSNDQITINIHGVNIPVTQTIISGQVTLSEAAVYAAKRIPEWHDDYQRAAFDIFKLIETGTVQGVRLIGTPQVYVLKNSLEVHVKGLQKPRHI